MRFPWPRRPRIAVLEFAGVITSRKAADYVRLFDSVRTSRRLGAVVLDIDSPGGSATASDLLYASLARLSAQKPVVAFIRGVGASGAYLMACAATRIVAVPSAIVGSIGVISLRPVAQELLQRLGVRVAVTKGGHLKDMGAFWREPTDEERGKEEALVAAFYEDFVATVARSRHLEEAQARALATGEVFTGKRARELGLVDELGDLEWALDLAAELARIPRRPLYVRPRRPWLERLFGRFASVLAEEVVDRLQPFLEGYTIRLGR